MHHSFKPNQNRATRSIGSHHWALGLLVLSLLPLTQAEALLEQALYCTKHSHYLNDSMTPDPQRYAPSRRVDMLHLQIDVTPDFEKRTVAGSTQWKFKPIADPLIQLELDAVGITVSAVEGSHAVAEWHQSETHLIILFAEEVGVDQEATLTIKHRAQPQKGLYFRTPDMGYKNCEAHLFTQGEPIEARHWYPCFDAPNEKFTSQITCHLPEGMIALSNGRLIKQIVNEQTHLTAFTWLQDKPHVNYLVSLVAGPFVKIEDSYRDIPLTFWTLPSEQAQAAQSFRHTAQMMAFFEDEIGVPYPWDKYDQVCVNDFVAGGMENTSLTTLTDQTLFTVSTENLRSSQGLVAHELAHQWFGDLVTCKDWSHLWLNEGFATYYDALFEEHLHGKDAFAYQMHKNAAGFLDRHSDPTAIVDRGFNDPMEQFGYRAYPKGSWILHMLRSQLGPELYRRCIHTYLEKHAYGSVVTENLNAVIEELSGRSFDRFFDQYVYHGGHPDLSLQYQWDARTRLARISISQKQKVSDQVMLFEVPATIRFRCSGKDIDQVIRISKESEDFYFSLPSKPEQVRFDPNQALLAKVSFQKPMELWLAQVENPLDMTGRLRAVNHFKDHPSDRVLEALNKRLQEDPFWGIRAESAAALKHIHSQEALDILIASREQSDARVRQAVDQAIAGFYHPKALEAAKQRLKDEGNPRIVSTALRAIADYHDPEIVALLGRYLEEPSYRNHIGESAIAAMRIQDNAVFIMPILERLMQKEDTFSTRGMGEALQTLGFLARHQEDKSMVLGFIAGKLNHPKQTIQVAAMRALANLQDPSAVAILSNWTHGDPQDQRYKAATTAIENLKKQLAPPQTLQTLREQVQDLEKHYQKLHKELQQLNQQWESIELPPSHSPSAENLVEETP